MVTKVGLQLDFGVALKDLVELEYDALEAYTAAISRLESPQFRTQLSEFKKDHERHVNELTGLLASYREDIPPKRPDIGGWFAKGKVVLGSIIGDKAILLAMLMNEADTNKAYKRLLEHEEVWPDVIDMLNRGLVDERRHKAWLERVMSTY